MGVSALIIPGVVAPASVVALRGSVIVLSYTRRSYCSSLWPHERARRQQHASDVVAHATISIKAISTLPLKLRIMVDSPSEPRALATKSHLSMATRCRS